RHEVAVVHDEVDASQRLHLFRAGSVDLADALGDERLVSHRIRARRSDSGSAWGPRDRNAETVSGMSQRASVTVSNGTRSSPRNTKRHPYSVSMDIDSAIIVSSTSITTP